MYNLRFFLLFFIFDISYFYGNTEKYYFKHLGLEQRLYLNRGRFKEFCLRHDLENQHETIWKGSTSL